MVYDERTDAAAYKHESPVDDASMRTITAFPQQTQQYSNDPRMSQSVTSNSSRGGTPDTQSRNHDRYDNPNTQNISRPTSAMRNDSASPYPPPPQQQAQSQQAQSQQQPQPQKNSSVVIKVGMVGDAQIGKTSLMVKYVEGSWDEDYIQTLGKPAIHQFHSRD